MNKKYIDIDKLHEYVPWITPDGIDYSKYPIEHAIKDTLSNDSQKFRNGCRIIISMAAARREDALMYLYGLFEHFKHEVKKLEVIAGYMETIENVNFVDFLFKQIKETKSSNTNRIYINILIKKLTGYPEKFVVDGFYELLSDPNFTYKMKQKFQEALADVTHTNTRGW